MKADSKIYKGIEYVQLNELPLIQQDKLLATLGHDFFIKIMIEGKIVSQCLQYRDYNFWYENVFRTKTAPVEETQMQEEVMELKTDLAL